MWPPPNILGKEIYFISMNEYLYMSTLIFIKVLIKICSRIFICDYLYLISNDYRTYRNLAAGNEMMLLFFSRDPRFKIMYTLLLNALERFSNGGNVSLMTDSSSPNNNMSMSSSSSGSLNEKKMADVGGDGDWVGPALLVLDVMSQSLLVDTAALKVLYDISLCLCVLVHVYTYICICKHKYIICHRRIVIVLIALFIISR